MFRLTPYNRNQMTNRGNNFNDFYSLIDDVFNDSLFQTRSLSVGSFKIDIKDNDHTYVLEAELPGVKKENITVDYKDDQLTINVVSKDEVNEEEPQYIHRERRQSSMQRVFRLKDVKADEISAKLDNGILTITAPKLDVMDNTIKIDIQ